MRGTLVTLSGIDGAGKTTIAKKLVGELESDGFSAAYHYGRYDYNLALPIMILGEKIVQSGSGDVHYGSEDDFDKYTEEKREFLGNPLFRVSYEAITMLDYIPFLTGSINYKLVNNDFVISDRYIYDTILKNLGGKIVDSPEAALNRIRWYGKIAPQPDYSYYLDISAETALDRKDDIPSSTHIKEQEFLYESVVPETELHRIDSEQTINSVISQIYNDLKQ